jgi:hypothetical protein
LLRQNVSKSGKKDKNMKKDMLDLYSDYLISSFGATTATGLDRLLERDINHDEVTQWLAHKARTSGGFWVKAKPYVRKIESKEGEQNKDLIMPLKDHRKIALSQEDKAQGRYAKLEAVNLEENDKKEIYLEGVEFPLSLIKQVFVNEDDSIGVLYLVTSDLTITYKQIIAIYRKRWKAEEYHKSLKQNVSLSKSPTRTVDSQANHFFAALWGYVESEVLTLNSKLNHFALKSKLYIKALQQSYLEWQSLKPLEISA